MDLDGCVQGGHAGELVEGAVMEGGRSRGRGEEAVQMGHADLGSFAGELAEVDDLDAPGRHFTAAFDVNGLGEVVERSGTAAA
jgi:hypothetical protein